MKEKKVRNFCVKMYGDPEPAKLGIALMQLGEEVYTPEEVTRVTTHPTVKNNELPVYAYYSEKSGKWVLSIEAPLGERNVVTSKQALEYIREHFVEECERNEISEIACLSAAMAIVFGL